MRAILDGVLSRLVTSGGLMIVWPDKSHSFYGKVADDAQPVTINIGDNRTIKRLIFNPAIGMGEAYMDGSLTVEGGSIYDVLDVLLSNAQTNPSSHPVLRLREHLGRIGRRL